MPYFVTNITMDAPMRQGLVRTRRGFSLLELVIVLLITGVVAGLALPKLNLTGYRVDAVALKVRTGLQTAQRTALTRQYDVIVSFDTVQNRMRIAPDVNNDGVISTDPNDPESRFITWRALGQSEGNLFTIPPKGLTGAILRTPIVGASLRRVNGWPSVTFHRDGSASSDAEIYVANTTRRSPQFRVITLVRSTGRTDTYKYAGTGAGAQWQVLR
jgi:prepilin-type N-terminal cleavage/methylation domain-containing protein